MLPGIFVLYTQLRYGWSLSFLGVTFVITGVLGILVQSLVVGPVVRRIGERGAVIVGAASGMIGFTIYALAPTPTVYFVGMPIFALIGLMQPGLQGLMTQHVTGSRAGPAAGRQPVDRRHRRDHRPDLPADLRLRAAPRARSAGAADPDRRRRCSAWRWC